MITLISASLIFAFFLWLTETMVSEEVVVIQKVGIQLTKTYSLALGLIKRKEHRLVPFEDVQQLYIGEYLSNASVKHNACLLMKDLSIICLYDKFVPALATLVKLQAQF